MPAEYNSSTFTPDQLIAGPQPLHHEKVKLLSGENRSRGAVLGRKATDGTIIGTAAAGNTGDGAIGTLSVGNAAKEGNYIARCIAAAANSGKFLVEDPDGNAVGIATVGVAFAGAINFTIADGATDFVVGDSFVIAVSAVTYKYLLSAAAAADGSAVPVVILAGDCDASDADTDCLVYTTGDFNDRAITLGAGHTVASVKEALAARSIYLIATLEA